VRLGGLTVVVQSTSIVSCKECFLRTVSLSRDDLGGDWDLMQHRFQTRRGFERVGDVEVAIASVRYSGRCSKTGDRQGFCVCVGDCRWEVCTEEICLTAFSI